MDSCAVLPAGSGHLGETSQELVELRRALMSGSAQLWPWHALDASCFYTSIAVMPEQCLAGGLPVGVSLGLPEEVFEGRTSIVSTSQN